jgi:hypothetical protein
MDLISAIQTKWNAAAEVVAAVPNGLHIDEAPEGTPMPFAVIEQIDSETDATFNQLPGEITVDFRVFSESDTGAMAAIQLVAAEFDNSTPGTGGYFSNRITCPTVHRHPSDMGRNRTGWNQVERDASVNPVYTASITYVFGVSQV